MKPQILTGALALLLSQTALAQGVGSHGGSAVACFTHPETAKKVEKILIDNRKNGTFNDPLSEEILRDLPYGKVELLDLYNARKSSIDGTIDPLIETSSPLAEVVKERDDKLRSTNYVTWNLLRDVTREILPFSTRAWKKSNSGVLELRDSRLAVNLDPGCLLLQVANQQIVSKTVAVVNYDTRLFDRMKRADQAALVFHERVYNYLIHANRATDSLATQLFVGHVFLQRFGAGMARESHQLFGGLGMYAAYHNLTILCRAENDCVVQNFSPENAGGLYAFRHLNDFGDRKAGDIDFRHWPSTGMNELYFRNVTPVYYGGVQVSNLYHHFPDVYPVSGNMVGTLDGVPAAADYGGIQVTFDQQGRLTRYVLTLSTEWTVGGTTFPRGTIVTLDPAKKLVSARIPGRRGRYTEWPAPAEN